VERLREALEKSGATYAGYCSVAGPALSEAEYESEIARLAAEYKSLFNAPPRDAFAHLEAWLTLCQGQKHVPSFVAQRKRFGK
jgi:hypothetical protein